MKPFLSLFLFIVLLFAFGCTQQPPVIPSEPTPPVNELVKKEAVTFMTHEQVVKSFTEKVELAGTDTLDAKALERKSMIIDDAKFLSPEKLKEVQLKAKAKKLVEEKAINFTGKGIVDLRSRDAYVVSQWNGTCTAHGLASAIENFNGNKVKLAERHIWDEYQVYRCDAAIKEWSGANKGCITTNTAWPHGNTYPKTGYTKPENCYTFLKKTTYISDNIQKAINHLDTGRPIYLGIAVTNSMLNCDITMKSASKGTGGGHALSIVGYGLDEKIAGGGYFTIKNSWGDDCAEKGYQYIPFNYCTRSDLYCDFWTIDEVASKDQIPLTDVPPVEPTPPVVIPTPKPEPVCTEWKRVWYAPWKWYCASYN